MKNKFVSSQQPGISRVWVRILDVIIVILCVILLISVARAISNFREDLHFGYSKDSLRYAMADERYYDMAEYADNNRFEEFHADDPEYVEYYAVGDYYKATWHANMYQKTGEIALEQIWREKQADAKSKLGLYAGEAEKIEEKLGIKKE